MRSGSEIRADLAVGPPMPCDCIWKEPHDFECDFQEREDVHLGALIRLAADVVPLLAEVAAAERRFAEHEKANVASRRSICALSDRYKAERDAALDALAEGQR